MNPTNSLSVNSSESLSQNGTLVTTKELAAILNVDVSTIQKTIKRLNETSDVLPKFTKGQTPKFNESQATLIKQEIQKHHNLASRQIDNVSTELEENETVMKAISILTRRNDELKNQVEQMQPKAIVYDDLVDRNKCINFRDMAAKIGLSQNEFMTILKAKYIYKNSIGEYRAYSDYQDLFTLRTFAKGVDQTGEQLMLNMKGITYFCNKYSKNAIADSFISKGDNEYQKIIDKTAENFIDSSYEYSLEEVSVLSGESAETILNFLRFKSYIAENNMPNYFSVSVHGFFRDTNSLVFTKKGKDKIVSAFADIKEYEKGMRKSSVGKAE